MSLGEVLIKALSDTLMGMGTVFLILIIISFIISLFKYIRPKEQAAPAPQPEAPKAVEVTDEDDEIAAVIISAIMMAKERERAALALSGAAATESGETKYIVRSIKRRR